MKHLHTFLLLSFILFSCSEKENKQVPFQLSIDLKSPSLFEDSIKIISLYGVHDVIGTENIIGRGLIDQAGKANIELPVEQPMLVEVISFNRKLSFRCWVAPNKILQANEQGNGKQSALQFSGNAAPIAQYLLDDQQLEQEFFQKKHPYDSLIAAKEDLYQQLTNTVVDQEFLKEYKTRLLYNLAAGRIYRGTKELEIHDESNDYYRFLQEVPYDKASEYVYPEYSKMMIYWTALKMKYQSNQHPMAGNITVSKFYNENLQLFSSLGKVGRDHLLLVKLHDLMYMPYSIEVDSILQNFIQMADAEPKAIMQNSYEKWSIQAPGKTAPDFTVYDQEGKPVKLSEFKGKTVFIDGWATTCKYCIPALAKTKQLKEDFSDSDVVILYIAIGQDKATWSNFINKDKYQDNAHYIDSKGEFKSKYKVDALPFYCFINVEGKMITTAEKMNYEWFKSIIQQEIDKQ